MESPTLARQSVPAEISEFARAELQAFADRCRRTSPLCWAMVQRLQRVCREELPATAVGLTQSVQQLQCDRHEPASRLAYQAA